MKEAMISESFITVVATGARRAEATPRGPQTLADRLIGQCRVYLRGTYRNGRIIWADSREYARASMAKYAFEALAEEGIKYADKKNRGPKMNQFDYLCLVAWRLKNGAYSKLQQVGHLQDADRHNLERYGIVVPA